MAAQKKLFDLFPDMSTTQRMPSTVDCLLKNNYEYYEQEGSQNGGSKVIMSEIDCVTVQLGALLSTQVSCNFLVKASGIKYTKPRKNATSNHHKSSTRFNHEHRIHNCLAR